LVLNNFEASAGGIHATSVAVEERSPEGFSPSACSPIALLIEYVCNARMKLIVQIQVLPDPEAARKLQASMERFNDAANWVAGIAFQRRLSNKIRLQQIVYRDLRDRFGLSAQMACLCVHRVCEAYKRDQTVCPRFRTHSAMSHDVRTMSFKGIDRVSLLTLEGRVVVP
jgi:predicted transposase